MWISSSVPRKPPAYIPEKRRRKEYHEELYKGLSHLHRGVNSANRTQPEDPTPSVLLSMTPAAIISMKRNHTGTSKSWTGSEVETHMYPVCSSGCSPIRITVREALEIGNATSAVKNTIPGDLPSSGLREIENVIRSHKSTGPQPEMAR